jgi:hypothetical protein
MQFSQIKYFYPVLISALPILFSFNIWASDHRPIEVLYLPIIASLIFGFVVQLIWLAVTRSLTKASLLSATVLIGFYSFYWLLLLNQFLDATFHFTLPSFALTLANGTTLLLAVLTAILIILKRNFDKHSLNIFVAKMTTFLIAIQLLVLISNECQFYLLSKPAIAAKQRSIINLKPQTSSKELPDVYFIVLDELGSSQILKTLFARQEDKLANTLKQQGFTITANSHSNYSITRHSLSSILNMSYLDFLQEIEPATSHNLAPTTLLIQNNLTAQTLKQLGYNYYTISSEYPQSVSSPLASFNFYPIPEEFTNRCLQCTPLIFIPSIHHWIEQSRIHNRLNNIELLSSIQSKFPGPRFVFCHFLCPHEPFIFKANGNTTQAIMPSRDMSNHWTTETKQAYIEQADFIGQKLADCIKKILAQASSQPIIIVQGDHGPCSSGDMETPNQALYDERFCIFNAYLVPKDIKERLYSTISPVNSFRLILSYLTKQEIPLLQDKCIFTTYSHPYRMKDVTAEIKRTPLRQSVTPEPTIRNDQATANCKKRKMEKAN